MKCNFAMECRQPRSRFLVEEDGTPKTGHDDITSIFAPSYPSKLWMHDWCIVDTNDVYGPALGL